MKLNLSKLRKILAQEGLHKTAAPRIVIQTGFLEQALKGFRPKVPPGVKVERVTVELKEGGARGWSIHAVIGWPGWEDDPIFGGDIRKDTARAIHDALESSLGKGLKWYDGSEDWMQWNWKP